MSLDDHALRQEIVTIIAPVRRFAYSLTGTHFEADDLLQMTIERILSRPLPADVHLLKWAFRICRNIWIDEMRARKVRLRAVEEEKIDFAQTQDGERHMMGRLALQQVQEAMTNLPDDQRAVLDLVAVEGMSYAEAADILDAPIGTIMSRLSRARKSLVEAVGSSPPTKPKTKVQP